MKFGEGTIEWIQLSAKDSSSERGSDEAHRQQRSPDLYQEQLQSIHHTPADVVLSPPMTYKQSGREQDLIDSLGHGVSSAATVLAHR